MSLASSSASSRAAAICLPAYLLPASGIHARYTPSTANKTAANACSPANAPTKGFPVNPGAAMPAVNGCHKQDYTVLIVVGLPVTP